MIEVMVDLETMSTKSNAAICSIGAVKFDSKEGNIVDTFYTTVDLASCKEVGLHISKDTVQWWSQQNKEALRALTINTIPLKLALEQFAEWLGPKSLPVWGNGAGFDNVVLDNAYAAIGVKRPWAYWHDRCYRTMKAIVNMPEAEREGTYHNALDDAMHQTKHLLKILGS